MNTMSQTSGTLGDKEIVNDFLAGQKYITANYNNYAGECVNEQLRTDMLNILKDEHCIQAELFNEMSSRGWYPVQPADMNQVNTARQKFAGQ